MYLVDLHCDTLYKSVTRNIFLDDISMENRLNIDDMNKLQCYAIWIPDGISGSEAEKLFYRAYERLAGEANRLLIKLIDFEEKYSSQLFDNKNSAYFTIENSLAINGRLDNIEKFAKLGVKIITLTWNASNQIGDGANVAKAKGLTDFGRLAVKEMEKWGIIVDISHASDKLFFDVAEISTKSIIATHSNSRCITNHKRNLTDEQAKHIASNNGIIGLNFHNEFLNNDSEKACIFDIIRHAEHFLSLGLENNICIGTDFDGCTLPEDIKGSENMADIYEMFLKHNYKESVINKIFYGNAHKFFENFDNQRIM